jgi:hypothetical protein
METKTEGEKKTEIDTVPNSLIIQGFSHLRTRKPSIKRAFKVLWYATYCYY